MPLHLKLKESIRSTVNTSEFVDRDLTICCDLLEALALCDGLVSSCVLRA